MPSSLLNDYLARLGRHESGDSKLWRDDDGRVQGQFFSCSLTSVFQPLRTLAGEVPAFDAQAQSYAKQDRGLSVWRLLNNAASDEESIELDRLSRMLHVLNFFRQAGDTPPSLLIDVHERLLAAVSGNHGAVFRRIVDGLQLPQQRIVLQLPQASARYQWAIGFVVDNYRRNGFRVATRAASVDEALRQLAQLRPDVIRIDAHAAGSPERVAALLDQAEALGVPLLFARVDAQEDLQKLRSAAALSRSGAGDRLWLQGALAGLPSPTLDLLPASAAQTDLTGKQPLVAQRRQYAA